MKVLQNYFTSFLFSDNIFVLSVVCWCTLFGRYSSCVTNDLFTFSPITALLSGFMTKSVSKTRVGNNPCAEINVICKIITLNLLLPFVLEVVMHILLVKECMFDNVLEIRIGKITDHLIIVNGV